MSCHSALPDRVIEWEIKGTEVLTLRIPGFQNRDSDRVRDQPAFEREPQVVVRFVFGEAVG